MPRRRMIDPDFWNDSRVKRLSPTERLLFIGMISYADDEGRLLADPAFLRSKVFPYDDFSLEDIISMRDHILETNPNVQLYQNAGEDYLFFRKWPRYQKPSHPQPSKLPQPPEIQESDQEPLQETVQEPIQEQDQPQVGTIPSQVSLGKVRLGKDRGVQEDFTEFLNNEKDLTDFLATTLENYMPRGPTWMVEVLQRLWVQALGDRMKGPALDVTLTAVREHPPPVLATAYARAVKYKGGKYDTAKYLKKILQEKREEYAKGRAPP